MQIQIPAEIFVCTWWSRLYPAAEATQLGRLYNESLAARWERRPTHLSYFLTTTNSTVLTSINSTVLSYHYQLHFTFSSSFKFCTFVPLQTVFPWEEGPTPLTILFTPTPWLSSPLPLPFLTWPVTNSLLVIEPPINHQEIYFPLFPRLSSYRIWRSWNPCPLTISSLHEAEHRKIPPRECPDHRIRLLNNRGTVLMINTYVGNI